MLASIVSYAIGIMTLSRADVYPTYTILGLAVAYEHMAVVAPRTEGPWKPHPTVDLPPRSRERRRSRRQWFDPHQKKCVLLSSIMSRPVARRRCGRRRRWLPRATSGPWRPVTVGVL